MSELEHRLKLLALTAQQHSFGSCDRNRSRLNKVNVVEGAKLITFATSIEETDRTMSKSQIAQLRESGINIKNRSVILLIAVASENEDKTGIQIQLHPTPEDKYLPSNIQLDLVSPTRETIKSVIAHTCDNWIQLPYLKCDRGETFSVSITLDNVSVSETFTV
jgi:Protein of unknown function (DUF1822)